MTRTLFFWWTKTKRCWSSCPFPCKDSKTSAGYYHFKEVCDGEISFCYSLLDIHSIFTCSIIAFRAIDYLPPPRLPPPRVPTRHFHILCKICEHIYRQKLLLAHGAGGGGGRYAIKLFIISIYFHVKNRVSAQNYVPVTVRMENWFHYHKILNTRKQ